MWGGKELHISGVQIRKAPEPTKGCAVELKVSDWQMIAWTLWACDCDSVKGRRDKAYDRCVML